MTPRRHSSRFMKVAMGCASVVLVVVALAAIGDNHRHISLEEELPDGAVAATSDTATNFQTDADIALKLKMAKEAYDDARGNVHNYTEVLTDLQGKLKAKIIKMDSARDDLVKRIRAVEELPLPPNAKENAVVPSMAQIVGSISLASAPPRSLDELKETSETTGKVKSIAKRIMFPGEADQSDPLTQIENSVLKNGWGAKDASLSSPAAIGSSPLGRDSAVSQIDKDVVRDLKSIVHRHLRSVSAGVEAARTTRDAADAAEHALGYTQHIAAQVGELAAQTQKEADRVVAAAKLTAEARDAMRAALQQSSQIVDYNTHAARAVAQDAGFVTTASSAIAKYLDGIFADRKAVRKVSSAVLHRLRKDEKQADGIIERMEQDEALAIKHAVKSKKWNKLSNKWMKRSQTAAKTATSAADHALQGEQAALQSGLKALEYARSSREASNYAQEYSDSAQRASEVAEQWAEEADNHRSNAEDHARYAGDARYYAEDSASRAGDAADEAEGHRDRAGDAADEAEGHRDRAGDAADDAEGHRDRAGDAADGAEWTAADAAQYAASGYAKPDDWRAAGFWGPQSAPRSPYAMPFWRNSAAVYSGPKQYAPYGYGAPYVPYTPFGTAPYGYGLQGSAASPLKRSKELVDSVVVLMQHLTRSLEAAGPNCQLVSGYLAAYQRGMATYRAQGVGLGNLLSDEDMKLVEQYAEVQVQSFASDLEDAMANAESYCGLAGGVSLANGVPTVALGQITTTHSSPYMRCRPYSLHVASWLLLMHSKRSL